MNDNRFSPEDTAILASYVTSPNGRVFAIKNLQGLVGAALARYSRAQGDLREILLKEFITKDGALDPIKADKLIERVLIAFGDESVGELENCAFSLSCSMLATKDWEDRRIGGSPIEKSTRYVLFTQKDERGKYPYLTPRELCGTAFEAPYNALMDRIFRTYEELFEPLKAYYRALKPLESAMYDMTQSGNKVRYSDLTNDKDRKAFRDTFNNDVKTKACDTLRVLLPLSTLTNVGISGNGRYFQHAISHCLGSPLDEVREVAKEAHTELSKLIPRYVQRAAKNEYVARMNAKLAEIAHRIFAGISPTQPKKDASSTELAQVTLMDFGEEERANILYQRYVREGSKGITGATLRELEQHEEDLRMMAFALFPHLSHSLEDIRAKLRTCSSATLEEIKSAMPGVRTSRRDRPGRAFEVGGHPYLFDCVTDFGSYKDLERHRMNTQARQLFTPTLGFVMPSDLVTIGYASQISALIADVGDLYRSIAQVFPEVASYLTLHGSLVRWTMGINDRALTHLVELRTTPQGHPSYRRVAQEMHKLVKDRYGWRGDAMSHVDYNDYDGWARGDAEAKQQAKLAALEKKGL